MSKSTSPGGFDLPGGEVLQTRVKDPGELLINDVNVANYDRTDGVVRAGVRYSFSPSWNISIGGRRHGDTVRADPEIAEQSQRRPSSGFALRPTALLRQYLRGIPYRSATRQFGVPGLSDAHGIGLSLLLSRRGRSSCRPSVGAASCTDRPQRAVLHRNAVRRRRDSPYPLSPQPEWVRKLRYQRLLLREDRLRRDAGAAWTTWGRSAGPFRSESGEAWS